MAFVQRIWDSVQVAWEGRQTSDEANDLEQKSHLLTPSDRVEHVKMFVAYAWVMVRGWHDHRGRTDSTDGLDAPQHAIHQY